MVSSVSSPKASLAPLAGPTSLPSSAKKKKQKLSEQIKAAVAPLSAAVSPTTQPQSLHPKKTTVRDSIKAAGRQRTPKGAPKRTKASVEKPSAAQPVAQTRASRKEGVSPPASQAAGNHGSSQIKATQALPLSQNYKPNERTTGAREGNHDWVPTERTAKNPSLNTDSGDSRQSKITLQDVKAALGRDRKSGRLSAVLQIQPADPSSRAAPSAAPTQASLPAGNREEQLLSTSTGSASANPRRPHAPPPLAPASPLPPLPPGGLSCQVHRALTGHPTASPSLAQFTSTKLVPASVEAPGARDQLEDRKLNFPDSRTKGWLERRDPTLDTTPHSQLGGLSVVLGAVGVPARQHLAQVKLKELPAWLALHTPTNPRDAAKMVQKGECPAHLAPVLMIEVEVVKPQRTTEEEGKKAAQTNYICLFGKWNLRALLLVP